MSRYGLLLNSWLRTGIFSVLWLNDGATLAKSPNGSVNSFFLLAEHGGRSGIRNPAALESALHRPRNHFVYEPDVDLADLAASYSFGLTRNHPFHDGNKRVSFGAAGTFVRRNGYKLVIENQVEGIRAVRELPGRTRERERVCGVDKRPTQKTILKLILEEGLVGPGTIAGAVAAWLDGMGREFRSCEGENAFQGRAGVS